MAVTEMMVRGILSHHTQPALLFFNIAAADEGYLLKAHCSLYNTCYTFNRLRLPILQAYAVPMISQRDAVWSNFSCPPPGKVLDYPLSSLDYPTLDIKYYTSPTSSY